jgi:hypothetical protein
MTASPRTPRTPSAVAAGAFQRALSEDRERTRTKSQVAYVDLNDGRRSMGSLPFVVVTPELRALRGWAPREPSEVAYREEQAQKAAARGSRAGGRAAAGTKRSPL